MDTTKVNFRCPTDRIEAIDEMAEAEHRDRSSMLNYIVALYVEAHYKPNHNGKHRPTKKAGSR